MVDPVVNKGKVTVSTGYNSTATSIVLATGQGAELPDPVVDGAYNLPWYDSTNYNDPADDPNFEIVRVTGPAGTGDTKTIVRAQEGTAATNKNNADATYKMHLGVTAKTITDLIADVEKAATVVVGKSGHVDYLTTDYGSDNACIKAAVDYVISLGGGTVSIREGTYSIEAKMTVPNDKVTLRGTGKSTIFDIIGSGIDCLEIGTASRNTYHFNIYDILIEGKSTVRGDAYTTGDCLKLINCKECILQGVEIQKGTNGIIMEASGVSYSSSLIRCTDLKVSFMTGIGVDIHTLADGNSSGPWNNAQFFNGCYIQHNGTGVKIERPSTSLSGAVAHHMFENCYIETQYTTGLMLDLNDAAHIRFSNVEFDGQAGYTQISIDASTNYVGFVNTVFNCDVSNGAPTYYKLDLENGLYIYNSTTNKGLEVYQVGDGIAAQFLSQSTTQRAINIYNSQDFVGTAGLIRARLESGSSTGDILKLENEGTGYALNVDQDGNESGIYVQSAATTKPAVKIYVPSGAAHMHLVPVAAAPGSPVEGDIYADTDHHLYYYNGTTWVSIA